jgi:hypothetical protein
LPNWVELRKAEQAVLRQAVIRQIEKLKLRPYDDWPGDAGYESKEIDMDGTKCLIEWIIEEHEPEFIIVDISATTVSPRGNFLQRWYYRYRKPTAALTVNRDGTSSVCCHWIGGPPD